MNHAIINNLNTRLKQMEGELRSDLESTSADLIGLNRDVGHDVESRADRIVSQEVAFELQERQRIRLLRVQNAIKSIQKGTYGRCRKCGDPISDERLQAQPETFFCIRCAP